VKRLGILAVAVVVMTAAGEIALVRAQTPNSSGTSNAALPSDTAVKKLNPFNGNPDAIKEGRTLWLQFGCSGCHGVMGGGGMAPPVIDDVWKFGSSDEVLFKLIKGEIPNQTMPKAFVGLENDQVWKMIAYVRSLYIGDPSKVDW
jgi:cytochrome c(L)